MRETRSRPRPTLWPSPKPPLCPRLPWRAGPRHPRPGLLSCARTRRRISSPAAGRPGQDIDQGSRPGSPTAWRAAGPQTDLVPLADPRGKPGPRPPPPPLWPCSPRGLPCGKRTERLRCECSPGPVHRDARRCVADARSGSRHSRPNGQQWVRGSRPPRSSIRPCCTPSFGPCTRLCLCAPMCRHGPQRCWYSPISWACLCA